ncbi:MAG: helix-turn-helix transcriptional regulator [Anaerolineae bacterium]
MLDNGKLYTIIGSLIRKAREKMNMTQDALSERLGLTRTSISNFERGQQHVQLHTLYQIAILLEVPIADLLPEVSLVESEVNNATEQEIILQQLFSTESRR